MISRRSMLVGAAALGAGGKVQADEIKQGQPAKPKPWQEPHAKVEPRSLPLDMGEQTGVGAALYDLGEQGN